MKYVVKIYALISALLLLFGYFSLALDFASKSTFRDPTFKAPIQLPLMLSIITAAIHEVGRPRETLE